MQIFLVRHGQTDWNSQKRMQGQQDIPLNEEGLQQTRVLARALIQHSFDVIYTSPLIRARQTTQSIAAYQNCPIIETGLLQEQSWGVFEGREVEEFRLAMRMSACTNKHFRPSGGENVLDVQKRALRFLRLLRPEQHQRVLVSGHGSFHVALLAVILGLSEHEWEEIHLSNCSITRLFCQSSGAARLIQLNDIAHLAPESCLKTARSA